MQCAAQQWHSLALLSKAKAKRGGAKPCNGIAWPGNAQQWHSNAQQSKGEAGRGPAQQSTGEARQSRGVARRGKEGQSWAKALRTNAQQRRGKVLPFPHGRGDDPDVSLATNVVAKLTFPHGSGDGPIRTQWRNVKKLNREQRIGYELAVSRIEGLAKKWRRQGGWQGLEPACSKSLRQRYQHARTLASELRSWPED